LLDPLGSIITDLGRGKVSGDVAGPIGIAYQVGKEKAFSQGVLSILNFAALLSINLGIMNLLPIPALDGGRAVFIAIEGFLSKRWRFRLENTINTVGFVFLLTLMLLITLKDVFQIVRDMW
jgi:regulator of sigma E protease